MENMWKIKAFLYKFFAPLAKEILKELVKNDFDIDKTKEAVKEDIKEFVLDQLKDYLKLESEEWFFWAILETPENIDTLEDFVAWADWAFDLSTIAKNPYWTVTEFHQQEFKELWPSNCTVYAPIWMWADNAWVNISDEIRKNLVIFRQKNYYFTAKGWYLRDGNVAYRKFINENTDFEVSYFSFLKTDFLFMNLINKGYRLNFGYQGTSNYVKDAKDWVLDDVDTALTWTKTYWHSTTLMKLPNWFVSIVDSYKWRSYNKVKISDLEKFMKSDYVFKTIHFIVATNLVREQVDEWQKRVDAFLKTITKEAQENNRFLKVLLAKVRNWYIPIYNDYNDLSSINAAEVKTLDDINNSRNG